MPVIPSLGTIVMLSGLLTLSCSAPAQPPANVDAAIVDSRSTREVLGAHYSPSKTRFGIWSPDHTKVEVFLDNTLHPLVALPDTESYQDVYEVEIAGNHALAPYHFVLDGKIVRDPYARMVAPNTSDAIVMDLTRTDILVSAPRPDLANREDAIIYEVHVRDFTIAVDSGIPSDKRGKFLGMVEPGSLFGKTSLATGIDHLKELGVTHIQLMPVYDFASCADVDDADCYNWGYDPRNYSVPEERYSLTPFDYENRIREFKTMINEFHKAGFRVIMDVVYNHTFDKEMFENISESYYTASDLSGTGNSIDATQPMVANMIRDSLEYWVKEYDIDGFRFDLVGIFDYEDFGSWASHLHESYPLRNLLIYGEPWNGYANDSREASRVRLGTIGRIADAHVGVFNSKFRDALKGDNDSGACNPGDCYVFNTEPDTWRIEVGSRGGIRFAPKATAPIDTWDPMFAMDPEQSINYVSAHDNLCLRDKILAWALEAKIDSDSLYLQRIQMFANGIILTSQGIPFLHGGVEIMRNKGGDKNSYRSPDTVNQYNWQWKADNATMLAYHKDLIAIRKAHPGLRMTSWEAIDTNITTERLRDGVVTHTIDGATVGDSWSTILLIYNSAENYEHPLPPGEWMVALENSDPSAGNDRIVSGSIIVEGTAVTLLHK